MKLIYQLNELKKLIANYPEMDGADISFQVRTFQDGSFLIYYSVCCIEDKRFRHSTIRIDVHTDVLEVDFAWIKHRIVEEIEQTLNPKQTKEIEL